MIQFKHILCPTDFSATSARALTYATALARRYDAHLEVLHVVPSFRDDAASVRAQDARGSDPPCQPTSCDEVITAIYRAIADAGASGLSVRALAQEGRAHELIVYRARALSADLLVMGTHGRSGFDRLLLGSITEKVLRRAPCPVLTVPTAAPAEAAVAVTFSTILCPIDYSPSALKALQYALDLARQANGCVTVLHAVEYMSPHEFTELAAVDQVSTREQLLEKARRRLHAHVAAKPQTWCDIEETVVSDRAYKAILRHAQINDVDLIVMGAQGTAGLALMVFGSNTQHVLRAATCPVLTVLA